MTTSSIPSRLALHSFPARVRRRLLVATVLTWLLPTAVAAQLGTLASPGQLSSAHAHLEGILECQSCHEPGRRVTAAKCLACHQPVAQRMVQKRGVHRDVADECATCHVEHNGRDAELRPMDVKNFDHAAETAFALDGRHRGLACSKCHTTRSFLLPGRDCSTCHADAHRGSLGAACATCHTTAVPFKQAGQQFDHAKAAFPLTGRHQQVACAKCHVNGKYRGLAFSTCASCHADPHAKRLGATCTACHTTARWKTERIDHARTGFPLLGRHEAVACAKCHVQSPLRARLRFAKCSDCHDDPHVGRFKEGCEACHKETGFAKAPFHHGERTSFRLDGKHAQVECVKCHKGMRARRTGAGRTLDFGGLSGACASCHADPHNGQLGSTCNTCHGTQSFKVASYTHPRRQEFFIGQHAQAPCAGCHARGPTPAAGGSVPVSAMTFAHVPTTCASCHRDVHLGQLGTACESCHRIDAAGFAAPGFSHERSSFPLTGSHRRVECARCHPKVTGSFPGGHGESRRFSGVATACASCHTDVHLGQLGTRCDACHTTAGFTVTRYTHPNLKAFFVGAHQGLECARCHKREDAVFPSGRGVAVRYQVGRECSSCHRDVHGGSMGSECASCHTPDLWTNPNRAFHKPTQFPLTGRHLAVKCESCHLQGQFKGTPTRCYDCHWVRRQDDRYRTRLGTECGECHRPVSWTAVNWNHGARTGLPLNVAHRLLQCDSCHTDGVFEGRRPECISCHEQDYRRTRSPDHAAAGFPFDCQVCHAAASPTFAGARFTHATYPLRGVHATQTCTGCHANGTYQGTPRECLSCHRDEYERTSRPSHVSAGFPTSCESCHREGGPGWSSGSGFNHASFFPLAGAHQSAACSSCHQNGIYKGTPRDCFSCHQADYRRAANPNHAAAGFPTACDQCHRAGGPGWRSGSFNHASFFQLAGAHQAAACTSCHKSGVYAGTPRDCFSCHQEDYRRAATPNHAAAGFPTTCEQCHRSGGPGWTGASFNHSQFYPLAGRHATQSCSACHGSGVYRGTPRECAGCHLSRYNATRDPNHAAAGFPTSCDTCHRASDTSWGQGRFDHTWFPITSGRHAGHPCSACHRDAGTFRSFTCLTCHARAETDEEHSGRAGYRYESAACYTCHPTGRAD